MKQQNVMKQQVDVSNLEIGMYVTELDRPWLDAPFLFQGFEIQNQKDIENLQQYCEHVYILEPEFYDEGISRKNGKPISHHETDEKVVQRYSKIQLEQDLLKINNHPDARSIYDDMTTLEEEIELAEGLYKEVRELMYVAVEDAKLGGALNIPSLKENLVEMAESVVRNPDALACLAQLKRKDEYTALHNLRSCIYALIFGRQLGLARDELQTLGLGVLLQDIGKVKVPDEILKKPEPLTDTEIAVMRRHVQWGVEILEDKNKLPNAALEPVRCHHEAYDGSGYLRSLKGEDIGIFGLIGAIVDQYDAMTSDKVYRKGRPPHAVLKRMYERRGKIYHPDLIVKFIQSIGIYPIGSVVKLNTGEIAVVAGLNRMSRLKPRVVLVSRPDNTPYPTGPAVNLLVRKTPDGKPCEIECVLELKSCGVDPVKYLPFKTSD
jgi:HD-GYP domain-containing protein (c-di-GMP phosphodiesterase class II)